MLVIRDAGSVFLKKNFIFGNKLGNQVDQREGQDHVVCVWLMNWGCISWVVC